MRTLTPATTTQAADRTRAATATATGTDLAEPTEAAAAEAVAAEHNIGILVPLRWPPPMLRAMALTPPTPSRGVVNGGLGSSASPSKINQEAAVRHSQCITRLNKS